jgi:hypothetical protein
LGKCWFELQDLRMKVDEDLVNFKFGGIGEGPIELSFSRKLEFWIQLMSGGTVQLIHFFHSA